MSQSPGGRDVRVYGTVFASGGTLVHGATPTDAVADATGPAGALSLVARRADGSMVSSVPAKLDAVHVHGGGQLVTFTGQLPAADAAGVEVYNGDQKISELLRSPTVPSVTVTAPRRGSVSGRRRTTRIAWRTTDPMAWNLLAKIEYSLNGGRSFGTLATKPTKNGADAIALPSARLAASRNARIRVRVNDGFNQGADSSRRFCAGGAPRQVVITSSARGGRFRRLPGAPGGLRICSPRRAPAGPQAHAVRRQAAAGRRGVCGRCSSPRWAASASRCAPATASALSRRTIRIRVGAVRPQFLVLDIPASVPSGQRKLRLRIASTLPARLRTGKRRFRVGRRARRLTVRVPRGNAPLQRKLVLAAGGKRTSVTVVVPRS